MKDVVEELFKALSCSWRIKILELLREGELCQCEIVNLLPLDGTTLSRHLKMLKDVGIIKEEKIGRKKILFVSNPRIYDLIALAESIVEEVK